MQNIVDSLKGFIAEPFAKPMSFWQYSALVGLTLVVVIFWTFILREIERGVKEI